MKSINRNIITLGAICVLTFICFHYSLHNQFTNWDDDVYVTNDQYIKALNWDNLKTIFTEDITKNNYHPLCMLSLAINYHFTQLSPATYYLTNILIHIANVILVFFLFTFICKKLKIGEEGTYFIASFGALWFGIHPMHVESVSWIAERKDVLYTFFYLAGLLAYVKYIEDSKSKWLWYAFFLFVASCLSKPMAVPFPISMLCLYFLFNKKFSGKEFLKWWPFWMVSFLCGLYAVYRQHVTGAVASFSTLSFAERIMYPCYGFIMYIYKMFNPTFLSTFYPYPYRYVDGSLPFIYRAAPLIAIIIVAAPLIILYRRNRDYFKIALFGYAFFIFNIVLELQFISVGAAIMADRYSYVAYVGLFFSMAYFIYEIMKRLPSIKVVVLTVVIMWSGALSYLCYERTFVWHTAETLLKDAIAKYPMRALLSYKWLGNYYMDNGQYDKALENYGVLTTLHAADAKIYDQVGKIYTAKGAYNEALDAFGKSLEVQNNVYKTYMDMSALYANMGDTINALQYFLVAYKLNPDFAKDYDAISFNTVQNRQYNAALIEYNMLIKLNPNNPLYYFYKGVALFGKNRMQGAIDNWQIALRFNTKDVAPNSAYNLSVACDSVGNDSAAIRYATLAKNIGYSVDNEYVAKLLKRQAERKKTE
jgi:tetratricopeptide (TPR) repeat protein